MLTWQNASLNRRKWPKWEGNDLLEGFPDDTVVKNLPANTGDRALIPRSGRPPGGGNGTLHQYSCLENPIDRGAWRATVPGVTKSWTRLSTHDLLKRDKLGKIFPTYMRLLFFIYKVLLSLCKKKRQTSQEKEREYSQKKYRWLLFLWKEAHTY